jgi:RNA polymerase sigma factor (sigma-70 family)
VAAFLEIMIDSLIFRTHPALRMTWERGQLRRCSWRMSLVRHDPDFRISRIRQIAKVSYGARHQVTPQESIHYDLILPKVAAGESHAMEDCIHRYGSVVWAIAKRYLRDSPEAEDLVQEVFTEIWKKAGSFDPKIASELTFVGMIARRRAIDFLRRIGRRPGFESLDAAESLPEPTSEVSSVVIDSELVKSSLEELPQDTRQLFRLFFENGFTHPEIAAKTGIPLGTVKTKLRRGLLALRGRMERSSLVQGKEVAS